MESESGFSFAIASQPFGEKFFKIKTKLLKLNDLKLCSGMEGRMKRGEMGGGAIFGQNIWVNIAIILGLYFFHLLLGMLSLSTAGRHCTR